jgi:hypothetical protein
MKRLNTLRNKKHMVGDNMPVFESSIDCPKKVIKWLLFSIGLTMLLIYLTGMVFGLIGETIIMLIALVIVWYLIDHYGDRLFKDTTATPTKDQIESYKNHTFPYNRLEHG